MKVYISLPITGRDLEKQKEKASRVAARLADSGMFPVNPFDTPPPPDDFESFEKYAYFMGRDLERLLLCDAVYFCSGWRFSTGCQIEFAAAHWAGKHIIMEPE